MAKLLICCVLIISAPVAVLSDTYRQSYSGVLPGGGTYGSVDPIVTGDGQLLGFVVADRASNRILIHPFSSERTVIEVPGTPLRTITTIDPRSDSLFVYVLNTAARLVRVSISGDNHSIDIVDVDLYEGYGRMDTLMLADLSFAENPSGEVSGVQVNVVVRYRYYSQSEGSEREQVSTSITYSLDLKSAVSRDNVTCVTYGDFDGDGVPDRVDFTDYNFYYNYAAPGDWDNYGEYDYAVTRILGGNGWEYARSLSDRGEPIGLIAGNFDQTGPEDELVYFGNSHDLLNIHSAQSHAACYGIRNGAIRELWYTTLPPTECRLLFPPEHRIVAITPDSRVVTVDYRTGELSDMPLDRKLKQCRLFQTGRDIPAISLVGLAGDTVMLYQIEVTKPTTEPRDIGLAVKTTHLFPNHPNPFNSETVLSFETTVSQFLVLKVYNILGQEVKLLTQGFFSPGEHSAAWDGTDNSGLAQSSGIYFARLEGAAETQIIKLIFVK